MARTMIGQVQTLLAGDYDGVTDLQQHIDQMTVVVDRLVVQALNVKGITLLSSEQELIERNLAAHSYVTTDQALKSKSTEGASGQFQAQTGMYLENSLYGQKAMLIDFSGCLQALFANKDKKICQAFWGGKAPSAQIPYDQRN